jgi:hypothetical protein
MSDWTSEELDVFYARLVAEHEKVWSQQMAITVSVKDIRWNLKPRDARALGKALLAFAERNGE